MFWTLKFYSLAHIINFCCCYLREPNLVTFLIEFNLIEKCIGIVMAQKKN